MFVYDRSYYGHPFILHDIINPKQCGALSETPSQSYEVSLASYEITFHPTQANIPLFNHSQRSVLYLPTPEGWKAELT